MLDEECEVSRIVDTALLCEVVSLDSGSSFSNGAQDLCADIDALFLSVLLIAKDAQISSLELGLTIEIGGLEKVVHL